MKNPFHILIFIIGFAGWISFVTGCTNTTPTVVHPPAVIVPDSQFCKAIAPLDQPPSAVGMKGKYWANGQTLRVKMIGGTPAQQQFLVDAFNEWTKWANLTVTYITSGTADIRVSFVRGGGSWSYIGTDAKLVSSSYSTMNIGWDGIDVCLHEIGHAIGLAHEQQSPNSTICWNKERVYADLGGAPNNWTREMVESNVFFKLKSTDADATAFDGLSIMEYSIPDAWTCDGKGIPGGKALTATDKAFIGAIYKKTAPPPPPGKTLTAAQVTRLNALLDECKNMLK